MTDTESQRSRGKPLGTRSNKTLHADILQKLQEDKDSKGDGMTPFALSKSLAIPDPTIRLYLGDLLEQKKVSVKMIANMTLYRIPRKSTKD